MFKLPKKFPLLPRKKNADKSYYGHALVIAGSRGMTGAAILASRAALEAGSGLVTLGISKSLLPIAAKTIPEVMQLGLPETGQASLSYAGYSEIVKFIHKSKINGLLIGPGLSRHAETAHLVRKLVRSLSVTTVLDADGINSFRGRANALLSHAQPLVVTPHQKEFERLFSEKWPNQKTERIKLAKRLSKFYDTVLVLKGRGTLVVGRGKCYVNSTGNPGMAKGGSGDVLAGMITAFINWSCRIVRKP